MPPFRILALDIATKTGWKSAHGFGLWDFTVKRDESRGMRLIRLRSKVIEVCTLEDINLIVFESVAGRFKASIISESELISVVKVYCEENKIDYRSVSPPEVKRHATGKGNANKESMIRAAKEKLGYLGDDDNEADALWIYDFATKEYNCE